MSTEHTSTQNGLLQAEAPGESSAKSAVQPLTMTSPVTSSKCDSVPVQPDQILADEWKYTSGRFLVDESSRMAERKNRFSVRALEYEVSKCMGCTPIISTRLYREGRTSRLLLMVLEDRRKVIVKVPYRPQPSHYATASEAATLTFLRSKGVPVPKVCGWSSSTTQNKAGVEYIVLEKANGRIAETQFSKLNKSCFQRMVHSYADVEKHLLTLRFAAYGSIYFTEDVPPQYRRPLLKVGTPDELRAADRYCIGPTTELFYWDGSSDCLTEDHGPWDSSFAYLESVGRRALSYMRQFEGPVANKFPYNSMHGDYTSPDDYVELVHRFVAVAPFLSNAFRESHLQVPVLRHPGLTSRNLFLCPSTNTILTIANWRHASILPFVIAAEPPRLFHSSNLSPNGEVMPHLPFDIEDLLPDDRVQARAAYHSQLLSYLYTTSTRVRNPVYAEILDLSTVRVIRKLLYVLKQPWTGSRNLVLMRGALMMLARRWSELGIKEQCPWEFSMRHFESQARDEAMLEDAEELVKYFRQQLGIDDFGWVSHERYKQAVKRNQELKKEWLLQASNVVEERQIDEGWMFQDSVQ